MTGQAPPAQGDSNSGKPLDSGKLGLDLQERCRLLAHIRAMVHSQATLLHESYNFDAGESDWGYCCDVGRDLLNRSIGTLQPLSLELSVAESPLSNPMRFARAIEAIRQQLFRAHAVLHAVSDLMRTHEFAEHEANLAIVMRMIVESLDEQISLLEPMNLGLPIPLP